MRFRLSRFTLALLSLIFALVTSGVIHSHAFLSAKAHAITEEPTAVASSQDPTSKQPAMDEGNAQRSRVLLTRGLDRPPHDLVWKSERLFRIRRVTTERFENGPFKFVVDIPTNHDFTVPIISNGVLFFTLYKETSFFYAIDAQTGKQLVTLEFERNWLSPLAAIGRIAYFGSATGRVYAYDAEAKRVKWSFESKDHSFAYASPAADEGVVYFLGWRVGLHAFHADTGELKWVFRSKDDFYRPAIQGDYVILASPKGQLLAIDKTTGSKKWETKIDRDTLPPAILDDQIFSIRDNGEIRAYGLTDGGLRWKSQQKAGSLLALFHKTVFFAGRDDSILALDAVTGAEKWRFKTNRRCYSPVIADGTLYAGCGDRKYHALDPDTGKEKWQYDNKKAVPPEPTFADGIMYVLGSDGLLYAMK